MKRAKPAAAATGGPTGAALVAHVQARREQERLQLSRMLHHDVAGMLAAARMDLSRVASRAVDDDVQAQVRRIDQLLDQVIRDARREMQRLHPALIDHFGLPLALRHLVDEACRDTDVRYNLKLDETLGDVEAEVLLAAFRLVEALLSECRGITAFDVRLGSRRGAYVLELARSGETGPESATAPDPLDLEALRTWLQALGVTWFETATAGRHSIELRIPRREGASENEAPGG